MEKFISLVCGISAVLSVGIAANRIEAVEREDIKTEEIYPLTSVVVALDEENDIVTVKTRSGIMYEFYGVDDWNIDDVCSMIMYTNATETVLDDEIIMVRYSGFCFAQIDGRYNY